MEEDPVTSYVPQTMTYQMRAHGIKATTPMHNPAKNKHRSAEEEALDFTGNKHQEIRPHSARDSYTLSKHLNKYLPMEDPSNYRTGVKLLFSCILSKFIKIITSKCFYQLIFFS